MKRLFRSNFWLMVIVTLLAALLVFSGARPVLANGTVENCNDDNAFASVIGGGGSVDFNCGDQHATATITLSRTYTISTNTTIDGGGKITLSGGHSMRLFVVNNGVSLDLKNIVLTSGYNNSSGGGAIVNNGFLAMENSTIRDTTNSGFDGGAIYTTGAMDITNSAFINNKSGNGGAIFASGSNAQLSINGTSFSENSVASNVQGSNQGGAIMASGGANVQILSSEMYSNSGGYGGAIYNDASTLNLTNTTVRDNQATKGDGGGMSNHGTTTLTNVRFATNHAPAGSGGGLANASTATLSGGAFLQNTTYIAGAGFYNTGTANLTQVTLTGNDAHVHGGGIADMSGGTITVIDSTISGNKQDSGGYGGGGLTNYSSTVNLTNVTVMNNTAVGGGAGLENAFGGVLNVTNSTISGNIAGNTGGEGGGLYNYKSTTTLKNVTFSGNSVQTGNTSGGGIYNYDDPDSHLYLTNVLVNASKTGGNCAFPKVPDVSDHNLSSDGSCNFGAGRDSIKLKLGPLETNGGLTLTHRLQPGSPAIDNGVFVNSILTDQRGTTRPRGSAFDVGSFEFIPCTGTPTKSQLLSPANKSTVGTAQVLLDWAGPDCVKKFSVVVRQNTKSGTIVFSKSKIKPTQVLTSALAKGHQYFWQVTACNGANCAVSKWGKFNLQ